MGHHHGDLEGYTRRRMELFYGWGQRIRSNDRADFISDVNTAAWAKSDAVNSRTKQLRSI